MNQDRSIITLLIHRMVLVGARVVPRLREFGFDNQDVERAFWLDKNSAANFAATNRSPAAMAPGPTPLETMGAKITAGGGGRPPLHVTGGDLKAIDYNLRLPARR